MTFRDILAWLLGLIMAWASCFFLDINPFGGTHARKIIHTWDSTYFHDSVVTVLLRHDTVKVPYVVRQQVLANKLDSSDCPKLEYMSATVSDTVHIIADCKTASFPLIDVRLTPIIKLRTDTVTVVKTKETVREAEMAIVEKRKWLLLTAYGEFTDIMNGFNKWAVGVRAKITLGDLGLYASPRYEDSLRVALGAEVLLYEK